jgi:hypothetical protein
MLFLSRKKKGIIEKKRACPNKTGNLDIYLDKFGHAAHGNLYNEIGWLSIKS